ncbi:hypothetical protein CRI70_14815 [Streptomyces sp. Ru87]|nr:hypothetical protein CRI70_14815 [Streptomyces sp. Ru87]
MCRPCGLLQGRGPGAQAANYPGPVRPSVSPGRRRATSRGCSRSRPGPRPGRRPAPPGSRPGAGP